MLWSLSIGLVAGWVANMLLREGSYGLIANLIVGLVGSLIGGWLVQLLSYGDVSLMGVLLCSLGGAVVLLAIVAIVAKRSTKSDR